MATTYDKASLVMIPSGVKEDKLYSIKPTDGSGDFTFSRGSDIEATRVNSSGLIEKAKENNILQSNTFDTTWYNVSTSETGGQSGYDGSSDAWLLSKTGTSGRIVQNVSNTGVQTFSIYAKAGSLNWMRLISIRSAGNSPRADFDLSGSGAIGVTSNNIDATIESIGGGWFRCSLVADVALTEVRIYPADANNDVSGTSGNIVIQDAQVNHGLIAQDYVETTTTAVVEGLTADLPRLDYSGGASCPSLLLEPSRTNLVSFSEYLNGGIWVKSASSVVDNDAVSPEGVTNAAKVVGDGTNNQIRLYDNYTFPSTGDYVLSVFAKAGNNDFIALAYKGVDGSITAYYNLVEGTTSDTTNGTIEAVGSDGWYRCTLKANLTGPDLTGNYNVYVARDLTTTTFPSNGDANGQYVHIYGAQLEAGSYPTSYIPTYGAAANRGADSCEKTGISSLIGQTEGTAFIEFDPKSGTGERRFFLQIGSGSTTIYARIESGGTLTAQILNGGTDYLTSTGTAISSGVNKFAVAYANNDAVFYLNGIALATSSSVVVPALSDLYIGSNSSSSQQLGADVNQSLLFKTRLTNAELAALTTI